MELEEAIKRAKDLIEDNKQYFEKTLNKDDADIQDRLKKDNEAIETVLNQLEQYKKLYVQASAQMLNNSIINNKVTNEQLEALNEGWKLENEKLQADLYEANNIISDYIDTTAKQEKMIELMVEHISFGEDIQKILCSPKVHKECACTCITCKRCIKQYFEKKAEEQLTDENKG